MSPSQTPDASTRISEKRREDLADPRPRVVAGDEGYVLEGARCRAGHALQRRFHRCPRCRAEVEPARFGPEGTIWSHTTLHVASRPGEELPYTLAYLDLDDGPRTLVRIAGPVPRVGDRVRLIATSDAGDPRAEVST